MGQRGEEERPSLTKGRIYPLFVEGRIKGLEVFHPEETTFWVRAQEEVVSGLRVTTTRGGARGIRAEIPAVLAFLERKEIMNQLDGEDSFFKF